MEILAFAFGVMYTPGPANFMSFNAGLHGHIAATLRFCLGVATAMLILFLTFGYGGALLISPNYQVLLSAMGCIYITYLAFRLFKSSIVSRKTNANDWHGEPPSHNTISFRSGLLLQLLNPKALVAIIPIVTVQFPAADISGMSIGIWSIGLSVLAFGAPAVYLLMGAKLNTVVNNATVFNIINLAMASLLTYVAVDIAINHVYMKLI
ncbi:transporter [Marinomonas agarivorans]|nr:transporter [Marinomonas agarivorans]